MSWDELTNFELIAMRKAFGFSTKEAAKSIITLGDREVTQRTWQKWETGEIPVPEDINTAFDVFSEWFCEITDIVISEWQDHQSKPKALRWFQDYEGFQLYFKQDFGIEMYRLYETVVSNLFLNRYINSLSLTAEIEKDSILYTFFRFGPIVLEDYIHH